MRLLGKMIEVAAVLTLFILVIMTIAAVIMRYCFHTVSYTHLTLPTTPYV